MLGVVCFFVRGFFGAFLVVFVVVGLFVWLVVFKNCQELLKALALYFKDHINKLKHICLSSK